MNQKPVVIIAACVLIASVLACSLQTGQASNQPDYPATITAQAAALSGPGSQSAATPTAVQASPAAAAGVTATVSTTTNCRSGPGTAFSIITALNAGQTVNVVGQDQADNYWVVSNPNGQGTCWLWGQYATVSGNTSALAQISPPSAPTPKATKTPKPVAAATNTAQAGAVPGAPQNVAEGHNYCNLVKTSLGTYNYVMNFYISWTPSSDPSIQGYRVYRDNTLVKTLGASAVSYNENVEIDGVSAVSLPTVRHDYGVESFNQSGPSPRVTSAATCP